MLLSIIKSTFTPVRTDEPLVATIDTDKEDGMKKEDVMSKGFWKNKEKYITGNADKHNTCTVYHL